VHFLPHILSQEGGKHLVPAFTRLVASRIGGYAARFGGYITDALSLPQNFNRTMQSKRATLDLYTQLGEFVIYPPGIVCGTKEVQCLPPSILECRAPVISCSAPFVSKSFAISISISITQSPSRRLISCVQTCIVVSV
jgi:hypothetical protein